MCKRAGTHTHTHTQTYTHSHTYTSRKFWWWCFGQYNYIYIYIYINNFKTSIPPISSKRIELSGAPNTGVKGVGQTYSPGQIQSSSTNDQMEWKLRKDIYIYIYIWEMCVCVWVCPKHTHTHAKHYDSDIFCAWF